MVVGGKLVIRDDSGQALVTMRKHGWLWAAGGTAFTIIVAWKARFLPFVHRSVISETIRVLQPKTWDEKQSSFEGREYLERERICSLCISVKGFECRLLASP